MRNRSALPNSAQPNDIFRDIHASIVRYNRRFDDCNRFNELSNLGWKVSRSQISGKGIISTKVYQPGDVIFIDHPLVVGPRCSTQIKPVCVICYVTDGTLLKPCPNGCSLPICANCENNIAHKFECEFIRNRARADKINDCSYNLEILRSLTVIRCLQFDSLSKQIVRQLHKIKSSREFVEVSADNFTHKIPGWTYLVMMTRSSKSSHE